MLLHYVMGNYLNPSKEMRPHCLILSNPSVFPSENWNWDHSYITKTKLVSVHCSCRLPERRMIQCTKCELWYHEECAVIVARAWSDADYPWICRKCISQRRTTNYCAIVQNIPVSFEVFSCLFQLTIDTRCVEGDQGSSS